MRQIIIELIAELLLDLWRLDLTLLLEIILFKPGLNFLSFFIIRLAIRAIYSHHLLFLSHVFIILFLFLRKSLPPCIGCFSDLLLSWSSLLTLYYVGLTVFIFFFNNGLELIAEQSIAS